MFLNKKNIMWWPSGLHIGILEEVEKYNDDIGYKFRMIMLEN